MFLFSRLKLYSNPWSESIWGNTKPIGWCDQRWVWMQSYIWRGILMHPKLLSWIKSWDGGRRKKPGVLHTRHTNAYIWIFRHQKVFGAAKGQTIWSGISGRWATEWSLFQLLWKLMGSFPLTNTVCFCHLLNKTCKVEGSQMCDSEN